MTPEGDCIKPITESSGLDDTARNLREMSFDDLLIKRL